MILVVDTNILFSFFRENPVRSIILNASILDLKLMTPEYAIDELFNNKADLMKYSHLSKEEDIEALIIILQQFVETKPIEFFQNYKKESIKISPDFKDAPFFALALKINGSIWSNEPRLKRQKAIKVLSTQEIRRELGLR